MDGLVENILLPAGFLKMLLVVEEGEVAVFLVEAD